MNKLLFQFRFAIIAIAFLYVNASFAQEAYKFTDVTRLPASSVKNQANTSTCWCFSGLAFLESEMMRMGKKEGPDLSEMYIVNKCYAEKARKFVRMHGKINFAPGGAFHDVLWAIKNYGLMPESAFSGLRAGEKFHNHSDMDEALKSYVELIVKSEKKVTPVWETAFSSIVDAYLGVIPEKFMYNNKEYTPRTFADQVVGINPNDYVEVTSFSHHPFYTKFALEIPDNWLWEDLYNVPINEFGQIIENAIKNGYTVGWASDVSEKSFLYGKGYAVVPDLEKMSGNKIDPANIPEGDRAKFEKMTEREKESYLVSAIVVSEKVITQELRQTAFDDYSTQDDHGMQIVGIAKNVDGAKFYIVKNSWGEGGKYNGYFYASEAYVLYKSTGIMVHKDAIPKAIKTKIGL